MNLKDGQVNLKDGQVNLKDGQVNLKDGQVNLKNGQVNLKNGQVNLKDGQVNLKNGQVNLNFKVLVSLFFPVFLRWGVKKPLSIRQRSKLQFRLGLLGNRATVLAKILYKCGMPVWQIKTSVNA